MRVALLALALLAAGCAMPSPSGGGGVAGNDDRVVVFHVTGASIAPGRCFDSATAFGEVCHILEVHVDNRNYTNALEVGTLAWEAEDAAHKQYNFAKVTGGDTVAGGAEAMIQVRFTTADGAPKLATLRYSGFQGHGDGAVPAY